MNIQRCSKCNGLLWGDKEHTGDFYCSCKPEEKAHLVGWECPRCRTIHSPFVSACGCQPPTVSDTTIKVPQWIIDHNQKIN